MIDSWTDHFPEEWNVPAGRIATTASTLCPSCKTIHTTTTSTDGNTTQTWRGWQDLLRAHEDQAVESLLNYLSPKQGGGDADK